MHYAYASSTLRGYYKYSIEVCSMYIETYASEKEEHK